jgi:hypothetical protein
MEMSRTHRPRRRSTAVGPEPELPPVANPELEAAVLAFVDEQLEQGQPPQVRQTLERLVQAGYAREGARRLIALVVVVEIFPLMLRGERYDEARYFAALERLPALPDPA